MLDRVNVCLLGRVIAAALVFGTPQAVLSQSLNVTCNSNALFASGLCDNQDMTSVEDVVNANEAAVADAQSTADQAAATNRVQGRQINRTTRIATTARRTANAAVATNRVQDRQIDRTNRIATTAQRTANAAVATNRVQDRQINRNNRVATTAQRTANEAVATNRVQDRQINRHNRIATTARRTANEAVATNRVQQRQINTSIANISANRTAIATNAGDIAANTTAIEDLKIDFAGLRTEVSQGFAMANAMEVFAPDPGSNFRLNVGTGFHNGETAFGITGAGRVGGNGTLVYFGAAGVEGTMAGKAGVSFQW